MMCPFSYYGLSLENALIFFKALVLKGERGNINQKPAAVYLIVGAR